jgi:ketosteroid isomerase-like protein
MRILLPIILLLAVTPVGAQRKAGVSTAEESKLIALENAWNQAQLHHDAQALDTLVGDSFTYTDYDGTVMDKRQFLDDIKDPSYRATLIANEDVKVHLYANAAVVFGTYHTKGTYKGKPFEHYGRFTDTWVYQKDHWQCVASHTNLIQR